METKGYQHNNLMDFDDLEDNRRSTTSDNSISWLSILAELEIQPPNDYPSATASSSSATTNQSNRNSNPFRAPQPQEFINQTYGPISGRQRPGDLFLDSLINKTSNQTFQPINTSTALNLKGSHSEENLSPTHSVNADRGATGCDYTNNIRSASSSSLSSLTPPPLPVKVNKYGRFDADSFTASLERLDQSPLQVKLDTNNQDNKYVNDMSWKMSDAYEGLGSRTDSISSTGSFHPYDSISLKKNFSIRSMRSTDSDSSTERYLQARSTKVNESNERIEFSNETYFNFPETTNSEPRQQGPLQVKLPDLETEEREFFGHKHSQSSPTVSPSANKTTETHRYSVGESKKHRTSTSTSNASQSPKDWIPGGGLFEVARERNVEVVEFGKVLSDIRSNYPHDESSNRGFVLSPALPPSFGEEAYDLDTEVPAVIYTESRRDTIRFIINVHKPVRELIELSISCLSDTYISDTTDSGICNAFLLKVCGKSEYLEAERELVDYEYVQQCLKLQQEVQFVLIESDRVSRTLARNTEDDNVDLIPRNYKDFFDLNNSTAISQYGLTVLMGAFSDEIAKVLQETTNLVAPRFEPSRIIQSVKAICAMLANIETSEIHSAVDALNELYLQRETPDGNRKAPDSNSIDRILTRLNDSVLMLVEMYCEAFDTDFTASKINRPGLSGTVDISAMTENLRIRIASSHRLPLNWKQEYEYFEVQVGVYYGGALLCPIEVTPLSVISKKFLEHLRWDEWLEFQIQVRQLPRESRLCVTLYGYPAITKGVAPHTPQVPLGWVAMQLFNFNGVLASGTQLLGLWPDAKCNPVGACTSNLLHPASVLMLVEFERYLAEIIFPDCIVLPVDDIKRDIPDADYGIYEQILDKDLFNELKPDEKKALWDYRYYCCKVSRALPLILSCIESWEYKYLPEIYRLLEVWTPMFPVDAMELLKVNFPDCKVRAMAVRWMGNFSDDELCDYLPQLVQALKYEIYHDSPLARFLIRRALGNVRLMHALFWYLKDKINDPQFGQRFQVILGGLLSVCGDAQREEFTFEDELVAELIKIAQKVKDAPNSGRMNILQQELAALSGSLPCKFRLPLTPSMEVVGLDVKSCGYFTSNSAPLRLVLSNSDPFGENVNVIFKMGDDMRQDTLTMQLVGIMSKIWFREGLDLKIITYQCMALGPGIGMIEIVGDAQTLREIHTEFGLTGSFKDEPIARWLLKHNPDEKDYRSAVDNFTASCAGYCVATYVLGICDRHNDNIMIRKSGHLFHIDFAKILGHAQMFGTFRRDRAPFVLTPDMAFVINGGYQPSSHFQDFVDLCCKAFNLIRRHANLFLNLLSLMLNSGISSLSSVHDLKYIRDSLLPNVSEADATATFTRLIHSSLTSWFTQVNFFIHNVAQIREVSQLKRSSTNNPSSVLNFAPKTYTLDTDGYIESARVVDFQKRHTPAEKYYIYVINICRVTDTKPTFVFRRFAHFQELHSKLLELFPEANLPRLPARIYLRRSQIRTVAEKRRAELDDYLRHILMMPSEIAESDAIYTFLHPLLLDEEEASKFSIQLLPEEKCERPITGEIKLSLRFERESLRVMVMHAKNLSPRGTSGLADPYVKLYLLPDPEKATKIKTKVAKRTLNPTYNETLVYNNRPKGELDRRRLQVTVWDDRVGENEFLGGVLLDLSTVDLTVTNTRWYDLVDLRK